jgi:U6 snRNA-associated Sm-like protein LSm4
MLVELKSGETLNGLLVNCDTWMNLTLREVVQTSADGDKFMRLPEIYVRGSTVRIKLPCDHSWRLHSADQIPPSAR